MSDKWFNISRWIMLIGFVFTATLIWKLDVTGILAQCLEMIIYGDANTLKKFVLDFGSLGPLAVIFLLIIQAVIPPIPAMVIIMVAFWVYGPYWGFVYSFIGSQLGAISTFWLAKIYGRPLVIRLLGAQQLTQVDYYFDKYGGYAVFLARLIPVLSVDAITYAAGASGMAFRKFLLATSAGQIPALVIFAVMGSTSENLLEYVGCITLMGLMVFAIGQLLKKWVHADQSV